MSTLLRSPKVFGAATLLFALASLYNMNAGTTVAVPSHLTIAPIVHETIQSGPAVAPVSAKPAQS